MTVHNAHSEILEKLPYDAPFRFVDGLDNIHEDGVEGYYTFTGDSDFYKGHFKGFPVTPGVLLTECCAQIGVVCLGIYLLKDDIANKNIAIGLSSSTMEFLKPVLPDTKVRVVSEKVYFRFQKLKCKVNMFDTEGDIVCRGTISGMFKTTAHEK